MNRRAMIVGLSAVGASFAKDLAAADLGPPKTYDEAVQQAWRPLDAAGSVRELVRAATLAANSHNTQAWRFTVSDQEIAISPDFARRCPAVDPDDHHLYASLGCAVENLMQAASTLGFKADLRYDAIAQDRITVALDRIAPARNDLASAITQRQCTRAEYDGQPLTAAELNQLRATGTMDNVACLLLTERARMEAVLEYIVQGNTAQMRDEAFMKELIAWIRFNDTMAIERLDGLSARSSGNPLLPAWIARPLLRFVMTEKGENEKLAKHMRSSAGVAVFVAATNNKTGWIDAGRAYQRFALQATVLGIRNAFLNQPIEVLSLRPQIAAYLGIGDRRPNLIVRFGRGPTLPPSLRRPIEAVIDPS